MISTMKIVTFHSFTKKLNACMFFAPDFNKEAWEENLHDSYVHYKTYHNGLPIKEFAELVFQERDLSQFDHCLLSKAILIDTFVGYNHLVAGSIPLLHEFAGKIGLKRHNFENKRGKRQPHYDIRSEFLRKQAVYLGACEVPAREIVKFLKRVYGT